MYFYFTAANDVVQVSLGTAYNPFKYEFRVKSHAYQNLNKKAFSKSYEVACKLFCNFHFILH